MIKLSSRIQLSPQIYLTFSKSLNNTTIMATSYLAKSRHLSFNVNISRNFSNLKHLTRYSTLPDKLKTVRTGPGLKEFLIAGKNIPTSELDHSIPYLESRQFDGNGRKVFFEIYGCQMNSNDGEVVYSVLKSSGYTKVDSIDEADVVLLVTCSIRDRAETKVSWIVRTVITIQAIFPSLFFYIALLFLLECIESSLLSLRFWSANDWAWIKGSHIEHFITMFIVPSN